MKYFFNFLALTSLMLSLSSIADENQSNKGMMEMRKEHMKCMEGKGEKGCQDKMMKNCKMNMDMCKQMMEDNSKDQGMNMNMKKKKK